MGWGANGEVSSFGRICSLGGFEGVGLWDRGIVGLSVCRIGSVLVTVCSSSVSVVPIRLW
jgi:hypothetical protein